LAAFGMTNHAYPLHSSVRPATAIVEAGQGIFFIFILEMFPLMHVNVYEAGQGIFFIFILEMFPLMHVNFYVTVALC
jgi:hypothetical protein